MTDPLARIRAVALQLPETTERMVDASPTFFVADRAFAQVANDGQAARVKTRDAEPWITIDLTDDVDWGLVEDRIAQSWELAAPDRLLEAGGR